MPGSQRTSHPCDLSLLLLFSSVNPRCGGNYTDPEGLFSLDLSGPFSRIIQCVYIVQQPLGEQIQVNFTSVELEGQSSYLHTHIEVTFTIWWPLGGFQSFSVLESSGLHLVVEPAASRSVG